MIDTKRTREQLGLSQSEMARACNTSIGTVTKWDQGQRIPRAQAVRLIEVLLWLKSKNMLSDYLKHFNTAHR
jgi:DNA-binding transcriptional regulator YiaG